MGGGKEVGRKWWEGRKGEKGGERGKKVRVGGGGEGGKVGTWFNRAVVSSQAFTHLCEQLKVRSKADLTEDKERKLRTWLANGMETVVPDFLAKSGEVSGAIYHLEDRFWVIGEA